MSKRATNRDYRATIETDLVNRLGLDAAARHAFEQDEAEEVEKSKAALRRMVSLVLRVPCPEPYLLGEFEHYASDRHRVCVEVDGLLLNYRPRSKDRAEALVLLFGTCERCERDPAVVEIDSLRALGRMLDSPALELYRRYCFECRTAVRKAIHA